MEDFAEGIKLHGIIQPVTVDQDMNLLAGGRRMQAAKMLNLQWVPALVRHNTGELDALEIELIENVQRKNLAWQETATLVEAIDELHKTKNGTSWSGRKTAEVIGRSFGGVNRQLQLAKAIQYIPELAKCTTEDEAFRKLKRLEEKVLISEMRKQQDKALGQMSGTESNLGNSIDAILEQNLHDEKPTLATAIQFAKDHYCIGDAFDGLEELIAIHEKSNSTGIVSLFEVDPPYAIDLAEQKQRAKGNTEDLEKYHEIPREKYEVFLHRLADTIYTAAGDNCWCVFWFGPEWYAEVYRALTATGWAVDKIPGIWTKGAENTSGSGQTASPKTYLGRAYETFFIASKGKPMIAKEGRTNVFPFKPVPAARKYHPTQRPVELMDEILSTFTFPGQIICSPFLGSGVTLRSAYRNALNGFGWELNSHHKDQFLLSLEEDQTK
jgi:ParB/RepB/Spo0J family partition protein